MGDDGGGSLISLDGVAPRRVVGVSASVIFPCTIKSKRRYLLALAHLGSPGKWAVIVFVCLCVFTCLQCFDTVGHEEEHSVCKTLRVEVLA